MLPSNKSLQSPIKWFIIIGLIAAFQQTNGRRIKLVPLPAPKVYSILREASNMDAVPQGRVVSDGDAAAAGFALGLKKSLVGVFLYEIITANITEASDSKTVYLTREICFGPARAARNLKMAEAIVETYSRLEDSDSQSSAEVRESEQKRRVKPVRNNKRQLKKHNRSSSSSRRRTHDAASNEEGIDTLVTINPVVTAATEMATETNEANEESDSNMATGLGLATMDNDRQPITCIVIQSLKQ